MIFFHRAYIALFLSCAAELSAQGWPNDSVLNATLQSRVRTPPGIGIVVATLEKGKPPRIFSAGSSGSATPLNGNTVFEIGSITKTFTSALLADMVQRGEVKLDDPVSKFLPATVRVPSRAGKQITLLDLATQSSGLPRLPNNLSPKNILNPYADYSVQQLYDFLSHYELTRITLTPEMREHLAVGRAANGTPVPNWDLPTLAGAGALRSTASDMAKFLAANLDSTTGRVARALAVAHVPLRGTTSDQLKIGLVWLTVNRFGTPLVWHDGGTGGYHSFIGFDPSKARGVVVLTNISVDVDDIGMHFLDDRFPLTVVREHKEVAINPAILDAYAGVYELAPNFQITVTKEGNSLYAQATNQPKLQLFPESDIEFFLKVVDASIIFVKDPTGKVDQIILHQGGASMPGKRV